MDISERNTQWLHSFSNKNLGLTLFITERCNFRCVYCYEDFKLGKMNSEVISGIKNLIRNRIKELDSLSLSFFGGEPLLNKPAIYLLSQWASKKCKENNTKYLSDITTNGYLLNEKTIDDLINSHVTSFQITIDGEEQTHNILRKTASQKPTFDKIYSNIILLSKTNHLFNCTIRFNVADSNFNSIKSFITNYSSPLVNDKRFTFHFHPIFGMSNLKLEKDKQLEELKNLAYINGFRFSVPSVKMLCYASRADSFVIRADGRVQKCTVAVNDEINDIGKIGNNGKLNIIEDKFRRWIFANEKECPYRSIST